jgi:hypothetical protein
MQVRLQTAKCRVRTAGVKGRRAVQEETKLEARVRKCEDGSWPRRHEKTRNGDGKRKCPYPTAEAERE